MLYLELGDHLINLAWIGGVSKLPYGKERKIVVYFPATTREVFVGTEQECDAIMQRIIRAVADYEAKEIANR